MADTIIPLEMGFAEFTAQLIAEIFEAIATSKVEQELRREQIASMAGMSPQDYASQFISDQQVEAEMTNLFPTTKARQLHAIFDGAHYQPQEADKNEQPAIGKKLGLELSEKDLQASTRGRLTLTQAGVGTIRTAVRLRLAQTHLAALRQLLAQGIPRVLVDAGHVTSKLTFQLTRVQEAAEPEMAKRLVEPIKTLGSLGRITLPGSLKDVRLVVRPTDDRAPQTSNLQVNLYGEVEITFKTIT